MPDLSPAAQAMITASNCAGSRIIQLHIAAALRALAEYRTPHWDGTGPACHWHPTPQVRRELLNIAAELEN
jgi:hypothetical protein